MRVGLSEERGLTEDVGGRVKETVQVRPLDNVYISSNAISIRSQFNLPFTIYCNLVHCISAHSS